MSRYVVLLENSVSDICGQTGVAILLWARVREVVGSNLGRYAVYVYPDFSLFFLSFLFIHQWLYSVLLGPGLFVSFVIFFYTVCMVPWMGDEPVARLITTHKTTQTRPRSSGGRKFMP
jgi:hypothetical protein